VGGRFREGRKGVGGEWKGRWCGGIRMGRRYVDEEKVCGKWEG
jgi:hypothetical protein